ncbi:MAG: hypothetical protein O2887_18465 [Bacteroidetes bacterium]|nr:hypothetical protein [Bacteroidota bacterium]MDA1122439.1 hypothetical protein [Bacteroidota bacterium]
MDGPAEAHIPPFFSSVSEVAENAEATEAERVLTDTIHPEPEPANATYNRDPSELRFSAER